MEPEVFFERYIKEDFEEKYVPKVFEDHPRKSKKIRVGTDEVSGLLDYFAAAYQSMIQE